jgi:hypothetical protein
VPPLGPASSARRILHPAAFNPDHPLNQKRAGWWLGLPPLSGGPKWYDICRGLTGTVNGGVAWGSTPRGDCGPTLAASTDQYTSLGAPAALELYSTLTVAAWAYSTSSAGNIRWVVAKDGSSGARGFGFGQTLTNLYAEVGGTGVWNISGAFPANTWVRLYMTYDGTTWRGYSFSGGGPFTGTSAAASPGSNSDTPWEVGRRNYSGVHQPFPGTITDVGIWGRQLSADELRADYAESMAGYPTMLRWRRPDILVPLVATAVAGNRRRRALICGGPR